MIQIPYQGNKGKLAKTICNFLQRSGQKTYYDFCCGSGAISRELLARGITDLTMVDSGPWGLVWEAISKGEFNLEHFKGYCSMVPQEYNCRDYLKQLASEPVNEDAKYIFPILISGSFAGKSISISDEGNWKHHDFRNYGHVRQTLSPSIPELIELFEELVFTFKGVKAFHSDCRNFNPENGVVYIDPPYEETTGYNSDTFDYVSYGKGLKCEVYISDSKPLGKEAYLLTSTKNSLKYSSTYSREEWITRL